MAAPPTKPPASQPLATNTASAPPGVHTQIVGNDYQWCGANADAPPQEIVDLAASLKNNWQLIYAYVYNNIATEPTDESTKGALGTYLDQSGNSFDQSVLLVMLLRAAGYQAQYLVGSVVYNASQLGLVNFTEQVRLDGGASSSITPYARVQVLLNGSWTTLDPANKTTTLLPGTNLSNILHPPSTNGNQQLNIQNALNSISGAYSSMMAYGSLANFIGGARINHLYNPPTASSAGTVYTTTLPATPYRTGISFSGGGATAIYFCTDQLYGHTLSFANNSLSVDGLTVQSGFSDPITITIWHPNAATPWGQAVTETLTNMNAVILLAVGQVHKFRAAHDANILNALQSVGPVKGTNAALLAAGSSQLSQTSQLSNMLSQLAGTNVINHHTLQIVRANNTIDTPMTSTSIEQITSTPASGLTVAPQAVSYALSAAQSAQEAAALTQAGSTQTVSAAQLLGGYTSATATSFVAASATTLPPSYSGISAQQLAALSTFHNAGFDLLVPLSAPASTAPLGFIAMNSTGTSEFVLTAANGVVYKGAADISGAVPGLGAAATGGTTPEAGPSAVGLNVDTGSGAVTFAAPLISIGSAAPYKLEFDLLYSSAADAQVTANPGNLTGRPEAAGVANNFEMRATASSDGFPMVGSGLAGPALPGVSAAYYLLLNGNALATYYASGGTTGNPAYSGYANAVVGSWLLSSSTNNVVSVASGLSSRTFYKLPWNGAFIAPQPSGDQLTQSGANYLLKTAHGDQLAFNNADGQISSITSPAGVQTIFSYTAKQVGAQSPTQSVNFLNKVSVGAHSLTFGYGSKLASGTYILQTIADETGRTSNLEYGNCFNNITITTSVPQLCGGTKPDWTSSVPWSYTFGYGQLAAANGRFAVLLNSLNIVNAAQNGLASTSVVYDGARMMPTGIINANTHTTIYAIAPDRSEIDDAIGNASILSTYPVIASSGSPASPHEYVYTDSTDPLGKVTTQQYNYAGQLLQTQLPDTQQGYSRSFTYDASGNLASTTIGQITSSTTYNSCNLPLTSTDALTNMTSYTYELITGNPCLLGKIVHPSVTYMGQPTQPTEQFTYYSNGQLKTHTAPDNVVTTLAYDPTTYDLLTSTTGTGPILVTSYGYDPVGNITSVTNPRGYATTMGYDLARRLTSKTTPPISAAGNAQYNTRYKYDLDGRLTEIDQDTETPGQPLVSKTTYDSVGNVLTQTKPTTGGTDLTTVSTYDNDERLSTVTSPKNEKVTKTYDADSRPYQTIDGFGKVSLTTLYTNDGLTKSIADGNGNPIADQYDAYDRLTTTTYADGTTEKATVIDNLGRPTTTLNRRGASIALAYDAMGRVTSETDAGVGTPITSTYDLAGRKLTVTDGSGIFGYAYNPVGQLTQVQRPDGKLIGYLYNADNGLQSMTYPDGYVYGYIEDELDRMTAVRETAPGASSSTRLALYAYNALSQRTGVTYGNGAKAAYTYDAFGGVYTVTNSLIHVPPVTFTYTRDSDERRMTDTVSDSSYLWHPPANAVDSYTPNPLNQYPQINGRTLVYGGAGNLTGDPIAPLGTATYTYDLKNRLITAANSQHMASYSYDAFSHRSSKTFDGVTEIYVNDGGREIADYTSGGVETQHYVYGADQAPILEEFFSGATITQLAYHHTDALGSVVALSDASGAKLGQTAYSPWGESTAALTTPFGFAGMRVDAETQLYYDQARYYTPQHGRFLSPDPISVRGGINLYAYAGNDPLNEVDPSGLDFFDDLDLGGLFNGLWGGIGSAFDFIGGGIASVFDDTNIGSSGIPNGAYQIHYSSDYSRIYYTLCSNCSGDISSNQDTGVKAGSVPNLLPPPNIDLLGSSLVEFTGGTAFVGAAGAIGAEGLAFRFARNYGENAKYFPSKPVPGSNKQFGMKFASHIDLSRPGYNNYVSYRNLANDIYNSRSASVSQFDSGSYEGETHYVLNGNLLRLNPEGSFRSLYPIGRSVQ